MMIVTLFNIWFLLLLNNEWDREYHNTVTVYCETVIVLPELRYLYNCNTGFYCMLCSYNCMHNYNSTGTSFCLVNTSLY